MAVVIPDKSYLVGVIGKCVTLMCVPEMDVKCGRVIAGPQKKSHIRIMIPVAHSKLTGKPEGIREIKSRVKTRSSLVFSVDELVSTKKTDSGGCHDVFL